MRFLRKSKRPTDVAVSTPVTSTELLRNLASLPRGDSRALGASTTAIALSIGSAFHDTSGTPNDGPIVQGRDTGWRTAYGAARMAVEIAQESSDGFLPLQAVAGALSALMKNFDVSALSVTWTPAHPAPASRYSKCRITRRC